MRERERSRSCGLGQARSKRGIREAAKRGRQADRPNVHPSLRVDKKKFDASATS